MADKYWFSSGGFIDIQGISIIPNVCAKVQALCFYSDGTVMMKCVTIEGEEYNNWSNNDDYLIALVGHKLGFGERVEVNDPYYKPPPITPYTFKTPLQAPATTEAPATEQEDTRSVHNDADIARIQTLQEQLDAQAAKLKTITDLLFKNGAI